MDISDSLTSPLERGTKGVFCGYNDHVSQQMQQMT